MESHIHDGPRLAAVAERQMQAWALSQETADRAIQEALHRRLAASGRTYVAISRETGVGASEIARLVGERLGWEVFDKSILDRVAERLHEPRNRLDVIDETSPNWVFDVLGPCMDSQLVTHEKLVRGLRRVIRVLGRRKVVIVGRGAQFFLPHNTGLVVRLVASDKYRIARIMARMSTSEAQARRFMLKTDHDRQEFVAKFFRRDATDPHLYDLVLNVENLGLQGAVEQILVALSRPNRAA